MMLSHGLAAGSKAFSFVFSSNVTSVNLRTAALAAGWDGKAKVEARVLSGVTINGAPAMTINGSWPGGVELFVSDGAVITGNGGGMNPGSSVPEGPGRAGNAGSDGLSVSVAVKVTNEGVISWGTGSGGTGASAYRPDSVLMYGGDGYPGFAYGGTPYYNGGSGTVGYGGTYSGAGGGSAQAGGGGYSYRPAGYIAHAGGAAGASGKAVTGNSNITWLATGTRNGTIA